VRDVVIVSGVRTAIGRLGGTLKDFIPAKLGAIAIKEAVQRAGIAGDQVDEVIMGSINQTEPTGNPARVALLEAGLPIEVPAHTVCKNCASGLKSITLGALEIMAGQADIIVAGGQESMSQTPHVLRGARFGYRMGHAKASDFLLDILEGMGWTAENVADRWNVTREEMDQFGLRSQERALHAIEQGYFKEQIVPAAIPQRKGDPVIFEVDEGPRATTMEALAKLRPAFRKDGRVTAGNSSQINDGAAAVVLMSAEKAAELGKKPMARVIGWASAGVDPDIMGMGPVPAVRKVMAKTGLTVADMDIIELNEAFAAQSIACMRDLEMDPEKVNVNGGAISLGHPVGASGAILTVKAMYELERRQARYALVTLCIGGGQGLAAIFERV
jgi:acetyl-CoA C-acetyltransferase